jgi:hypothetical protein
MTDFSAIRRLFGITERRGFPAEEIAAVREHYGALPQVLTDYYAELGADNALNATQDRLIPPGELFSPAYQDEEYLVFYEENQGVCHWGIRKADLTQDDPPVYITYDSGGEWQKESETLTGFLTAIAHLQSVFALPFQKEEFSSITPDERDFIRENFQNKGCALPLWLSIEFYGNHDDSVIVVMKNNDAYDLLYASNNKAHFAEMDALLGGLGAGE